jgi:hypothetical protein
LFLLCLELGVLHIASLALTNQAKFGELVLVDMTKEGLDVGEDAGRKVSLVSLSACVVSGGWGVDAQCWCT